jgi:mevalonate kinase
MKSVTVSAPGKIHLMGEHAIVYGKPALLSAIDLRLSVTVESAHEYQIVPKKSADRISQAISIIRDTFALSHVSTVRVSIFSDIPSGFHLGSSAAVAVALTGALMKFDTDQFDSEKINAIAYEVEKMFHGNPSGGDNTIITHGGNILYQKFSETDKRFTSMVFPESALFNNFFLIQTGKPESTKTMVASVKHLFETDQTLKDRVLDQNEQATMMILDALQIGDERTFINGIRHGEKTLESMGVVSGRAVEFIRSVEKAGGAAKILGGGGKKDGVGCILVYQPEKCSFLTIIKQFGYAVRPVRLGGTGVRLEAVSHDIIASL